MLGGIGGRRRRGRRDEMAGWHHQLNGREFEWTPGVGDGQRGLACCDSWDHKNSTWLSDWTEMNWIIKLPTSAGSWKKQESSRKNIYLCFIDYAKAFDCVNHNKLWKILKEMGIINHLTCFLRNMYAGQEATVRTRHGTTDWFQIGKGVCQGCICHPAYLTSMQSTSWETLGWKKHKLE